VEVTCSKKDLLSALSAAQSAVSRRTTLPALANLLLEAVEGNLSVMGTDLELSIKCQTPGNILSEGRITLPSQKLFDIVRELPEGEIVIKTDGLSAEITCERANFRLQGMGAEEYPSWPSVSGQVLRLPKDTIQDMFRQTVFAVSEDETRYTMSGICMQMEGRKLICVATDGYRLAYRSEDIKVEPSGIIDIILPAKAVDQLVKLMSSPVKGGGGSGKGGSEEVEVTFGETHILWNLGDAQVISRLIEGKFPPYREAIPAEFPLTATVERPLLNEVVSRVSLMADERSKQVILSISADNIEVKASAADLGEGRENIPANYSGEAMTIGYNATFLLEVLKSFDDDIIAIDLIDPLKHGRFHATGNLNHFCILMPTKL
jgi:DNA polymerase-3 subunit beta